MSSNIYDFSLAANVGASQLLNVQGTRVLVLSALGGQVEVTTDKGDKFKLLEGQGFDSESTDGFNWIMVRNLQAVANAGTIFAGDEFFIDRRITGTVSVVDSAKERTRANLAFMDYGFQTASINTNTPSVQLWNPAGSGKRAIVNSLTVSVSGANSFINVAISATQASALRNAARSKLSGGALASTQVRVQDGAVLFGSAYIARAILVNVPQVFTFATPVVLLPGYGLSASPDAGAVILTTFADFDFQEEPNT